eukprot:5296796-Amphidinium_carterae.1
MNLPIYGQLARARSAWYETCQQQNRLVLASLLLLPLYNNMLLLACTVVADHFRFHVVGVRVPLAVHMVACLHLGFYQSAVRFQDRHATKKTGVRLWNHDESRVY